MHLGRGLLRACEWHTVSLAGLASLRTTPYISFSETTSSTTQGYGFRACLICITYSTFMLNTLLALAINTTHGPFIPVVCRRKWWSCCSIRQVWTHK